MTLHINLNLDPYIPPGPVLLYIICCRAGLAILCSKPGCARIGPLPQPPQGIPAPAIPVRSSQAHVAGINLTKGLI